MVASTVNGGNDRVRNGKFRVLCHKYSPKTFPVDPDATLITSR